jgi:hypothetical protein
MLTGKINKEVLVACGSQGPDEDRRKNQEKYMIQRQETK